jgi:cytochrome c oxidase cbb3-type subunit 3
MKIVIAFIVGLIAAPILFVLVGIAGMLPTEATSSPSKWESSIAMRALDASLEKRSSGAANPIAANDSAALAAGKTIFDDNCAGCHGSAKGPSGWGASGLYPRAPQFFQQGTDVSPTEAYAAIRDGVRYTGMGAWRGQLNDDQMWKVANYVASIKGNGKMKDMD